MMLLIYEGILTPTQLHVPAVPSVPFRPNGDAGSVNFCARHTRDRLLDRRRLNLDEDSLTRSCAKSLVQGGEEVNLYLKPL